MQTVGREPPLLHQPGAPDAVAVRLLPSVGGSCAELTVAAEGATEAATMGAPARYARVDDNFNTLSSQQHWASGISGTTHMRHMGPEREPRVRVAVNPDGVYFGQFLLEPCSTQE